MTSLANQGSNLPLNKIGEASVSRCTLDPEGWPVRQNTQKSVGCMQAIRLNHMKWSTWWTTILKHSNVKRKEKSLGLWVVLYVSPFFPWTFQVPRSCQNPLNILDLLEVTSWTEVQEHVSAVSGANIIFSILAAALSRLAKPASQAAKFEKS